MLRSGTILYHGATGTALTRRCFGETIGHITTSFPRWFCPAYAAYDQREGELPVDQHELIALIAPRPVYVASAEEDVWCDPRGEFLACVGADPVHRLLGGSGLNGATEWPAAGAPTVGGSIGYICAPVRTSSRRMIGGGISILPTGICAGEMCTRR